MLAYFSRLNMLKWKMLIPAPSLTNLSFLHHFEKKKRICRELDGHCHLQCNQWWESRNHDNYKFSVQRVVMMPTFLSLWAVMMTSSSARDQSRYAPSQWDASLHCIDVAHWPGANLDWFLSASSDNKVGIMKTLYPFSFSTLSSNLGNWKITDHWALFQYPIRHLIVRSCDASKLQDW